MIADQRDGIGIGVPGSELIGAVAGPHEALGAKSVADVANQIAQIVEGGTAVLGGAGWRGCRHRP